jgi:putative ABC transport system substrate-binding protein
LTSGLPKFWAISGIFGVGYVNSLARPGGDATGFMNFEFGNSGKWLELLRQIVPSMSRVAVLRDPILTGGIGQFGAIQAVTPSLRVEVNPINVREAPEIERAITAFGRSSNVGLIVTTSSSRNQRVKPTLERIDHRTEPGYELPPL